MKEKEVQNLIKQWLRSNNFYCQTVQSGVIQQVYLGKPRYIHLADAGTPDILSCINGQFVAIEVKRSETEVKRWKKKVDNWLLNPTNSTLYPREVYQYQQIQEIKKAGGVGLVVGSLDELINDLKTLKFI